MEFNDSSGNWENIGGPSETNNQDYVSLSVFSGVPYIAFRRLVGTAFEAVVEKYNNSNDSWEAVGSLDNPGENPGNVSLSIDNATGALYIAYQDYWSSGGNLTVRKFNSGSGSWETVGNPGFATAYIPGPFGGTQLFVRNGVPYVAFQELLIDNKATVMKYNSALDSWVTVGSQGFSGRSVNNISLYVTEDGVPFVAFGLQQPDPESESSNKATVMEYISTIDAWAFVGEPCFSAWDADYISLFVSNGVPYVAFKDTGALAFGRASLMKYNGVTWDYVGEQGFSGIGHAAIHTSLFIYNDIPYVAYSDVDLNNKATVMRYF
jgi:hypothetical protein